MPDEDNMSDFVDDDGDGAGSGAGSDSDPQSGDDGIDHDEVILGNTTDLILYLARALGNEFHPFFAEIAPSLVPYTSDKHPKSDRHMAIGAIGEVFAAC